MAPKIQITLTLEDKYIKYIKAIADDCYDGNMSMAARKIVAYHSVYVNYKPLKGKTD